MPETTLSGVAAVNTKTNSVRVHDSSFFTYNMERYLSRMPPKLEAMSSPK